MKRVSCLMAAGVFPFLVPFCVQAGEGCIRDLGYADTLEWHSFQSGGGLVSGISIADHTQRLDVIENAVEDLYGFLVRGGAGGCLRRIFAPLKDGLSPTRERKERATEAAFCARCVRLQNATVRYGHFRQATGSASADSPAVSGSG